MATCAQCNTQKTQVYENGGPVCLKCSETRTAPRKPPATASSQDVRTTLVQELLRTTALSDEAAMEFNKMLSQLPNELPYPDGGHGIVNAARKLAFARTEMVMAHSGLSDYLEHDDVRKGVKRSA